MADPITSALVSDVVGRLTSAAIQEYGLLTGLDDHLSSLEDSFKQIQGVLHAAEMKQTNDKRVEEWLRTLKSASLEAENLLDEAKTEAMIKKLRWEIGRRYKVKALFSSHNSLMVKTGIAHRVKSIRKKLEVIDDNRYKFKLTPNTASENGAGIGGDILNRETSSLVPKIYGRDEEKKMMIDKICNQDNNDVRVYAIWGMGGIGKTTLAQYVYNHKTVKKCFKLTYWVYVSDVFDVKRIIKSICGSEDEQLDTMQACLQNTLRDQKFLIVMDDVWIENKDMEKWDELCKALSCGAKGSTVMVTTRKEDTAQLMARIPELQHNLAVLSVEESWLLFKMLAFPGGGEGENLRELELVGREIVEKCKGLPLAVKTLGSLMSTKKKVNEWQLVNDKFMSEMQDNDILTALRLSYDNLLPHLRRCFAYCCLFPKGEEMSKDSLIELWMANGFIPSQGDVSLYVLGEEIFTCLVRRSFFQDVVEEDLYTGEIFKMHDLMHDLARYVMRHDCAVLLPGKKLITPPDEVLHLSLSCKDFEFSKLKLRKLRSMLVFKMNYTSNIRQISNHVYLRVLYLNGIRSSTSPESVCKLIHLRYLIIKHSDIQVLPDTIIYLQNLETLILKECHGLRELPKGLRYMRNLQRLDTGSCPDLQHIPVGIKELTNLRRLSRFVVSKKEGAQIGELGNLNLLGWNLWLSGLENVGGSSDAESVNLKDKTNLKSLGLDWSWDTHRRETFDLEVLEGLEPNSGLQELTIRNYMGRVISPSWMIKLVSLASIELNYLPKSEQLPPLGKLPSLKRIILFLMRSLNCFHDDDNAPLSDEIIFPNLQELKIFECSALVSLPSNFPKLISLDISFSDKLCSLPDMIQSSRDLYEVTIIDCKILSRRCEKEIGEDWPKISHILHLDIR